MLKDFFRMEMREDLFELHSWQKVVEVHDDCRLATLARKSSTSAEALAAER